MPPAPRLLLLLHWLDQCSATKRWNILVISFDFCNPASSNSKLLYFSDAFIMKGWCIFFLCCCWPRRRGWRGKENTVTQMARAPGSWTWKLLKRKYCYFQKKILSLLKRKCCYTDGKSSRILDMGTFISTSPTQILLSSLSQPKILPLVDIWECEKVADQPASGHEDMLKRPFIRNGRSREDFSNQRIITIFQFGI